MSIKTYVAEEEYDAYTLETLAVIKAIEKFRVYLLGKHFKIITDCDAFRKTMDKKELAPKIRRWIMFLQDYDYVVVYRAGEKVK